MRLFCALRLPGGVLDAVAAWQAVHLQSVHLRGGRPVARVHLHVTLAFLGDRPEAELPGIVRELAAAAGRAAPIRLEPLRYRETRSVGMLVLADEGAAAAALAADLGERLERIGSQRRERRPWTAHLTVCRFRERPRLELPPPALGAVSPSDGAVYSSVLRPQGAQYQVLESVALGGR